MKIVMRIVLVTIFLLGSFYAESSAKILGYDGVVRPTENVVAIKQVKNNSQHVLKIEVNIQDEGWKTFYDSEEAGTVGQSKRIEGIAITSYKSPISYRVYVDGKGWTKWGRDGQKVGNDGTKKAIKAIEIKGDYPYNIHVSNIGWLPKNIENDGTAGYIEGKYRIEAIRFEIVEI